mmetsp:Transcript_32081/g.96142  ORF Transcript_32081/g.96142 Transcript_32081/m.96142 type:complete len:119 (-) Transcript_32081:557-913(-)
MKRIGSVFAVALPAILSLSSRTDAFSLVMMGSRRGKGNLKRSLDPSTMGDKSRPMSVKSLNQGRGQEITGVTLPAEGEYHVISCTPICHHLNKALESFCVHCSFTDNPDLFLGINELR